GGRQVDRDPAAIAGVGCAGDQAGLLERGNGGGHRLGADVLGGGQRADPRRAAAVEPAEHDHLGEREAAALGALGAQPADDPSEDDAQLARNRFGLDHICSIPEQFACRIGPVASDRYKWVALSNVTLGIHLDPLVPSNSFYLLWMILGYLVVSSVLIVSLGRLGDMYGRVRIYNLGF